MDKTKLEEALEKASSEMDHLEFQLSRAVTYTEYQNLVRSKLRLQSLREQLVGQLIVEASNSVETTGPVESASHIIP